MVGEMGKVGKLLSINDFVEYLSILLEAKDCLYTQFIKLLEFGKTEKGEGPNISTNDWGVYRNITKQESDEPYKSSNIGGGEKRKKEANRRSRRYGYKPYIFYKEPPRGYPLGGSIIVLFAFIPVSPEHHFLGGVTK